MQQENLYEILGISKDVSQEDIKKAYRSIAMKCHPDKVKDENNKKEMEEKFKKAQNAYSILSDDEKRRHYDLGGTVEDLGSMEDVINMMFGGGSPFHVFSTSDGSQSSGSFVYMTEDGGDGFTFASSFDRFFQGFPSVGVSHNRTTMSQQYDSDGDSDGDNDGGCEDDILEEDFMDHLQSFLRRTNRRSYRNQYSTTSESDFKQNDYKANCYLTLKDILCGSVHNVKYDFKARCESCKGFACFRCNGTGCKSCGGGCTQCKRQGFITKTGQLTVQSVPGQPTGSTVSIKNPSNNHNVEVTFKYKLSKSITILENNINIRFDVSLEEILCGFQTVIHIPDKSQSQIKIHKKGYFKPVPETFKELGVPFACIDGQNKKRGNVVVNYDIVYPEPNDPIIQKITQIHPNSKAA